MEVLLRCIIDLSSTLDVLNNNNNKNNATEEETRVFNNIKNTFLSLCTLELSADVNPTKDLYHSSGLSRELYSR
jgi:hypothetical protein